MKYVLIDMRETDCYEEEFNTLEEAKAQANLEWSQKTEYDKERCIGFYVSAVEDDRFDDLEDGDWDSDVVYSIKMPNDIGW